MIVGLFSIRIYHQFENFEGHRLDEVSAFDGNVEGNLSGANTDVRPGYGKLLELAANSLIRNDEICTDLEQHASSLCQKIFRKNGCSIDSFETEWRI